MAGAPKIEVRPAEARLSRQTEKKCSSHVTLHNPSGITCAFKVMTTAPRKYCVRPTTGYVEAMGSLQIDLVAEARRVMPVDDQAATVDKFIVLITPAEKTEIGPGRDLFVETVDSNLQKAPFVVIASGSSHTETSPNEQWVEQENGSIPEATFEGLVNRDCELSQQLDAKRCLKGRSISSKLQDEVHLIVKRSKMAGSFSSRFSFKGKNKEEKGSKRLLGGSDFPRSGRMFGNYFVHAVSAIASHRQNG